MAKAFSDRPAWQRWGIVGGWLFLGLVVIAVVFGDEPKPVADKPLAVADMSSVRSQFLALAGPCDAAQTQVGQGLQDLAGGDRVALARAVNAMEINCKAAWLETDDLPDPAAMSDAQEVDLDAFREACSTAFFVRHQLAKNLRPGVDGDMRPSVMAALQDEMRAAQAQSLACAAAMIKVMPPEPQPGAESAE